MPHTKARIQINSVVAVTHVSKECLVSVTSIVDDSSGNSTMRITVMH